jgi:hypothetical protein
MNVAFGRCFAYNDSGAQLGKSSREKKMAKKKTLKKSKKIQPTKPLLTFRDKV